jgi:hypothetical protein
MPDDNLDKLAKIFAGEDFQDAVREAEQTVGYQGPADPRPSIYEKIFFIAVGVFIGWKNPRRPFGSGRKDPNDLKLLMMAQARAAAMPNGNLKKILLQIVRRKQDKSKLRGKADKPLSPEVLVKRVMRRRNVALALVVDPDVDHHLRELRKLEKREKKPDNNKMK